MLDLQQFRCVVDSAIPVVIVTNSTVEKVITQNPVKRFSLGRFCPDRFGRDVHPG
jgi:hypothetical protein